METIEKGDAATKSNGVQTAVQGSNGQPLGHKPTEQQLHRGFSLLSLLGKVEPLYGRYLFARVNH